MRERLIMLAKEAEQEAELQARFSQMAKQAEETPTMPEGDTTVITKDDWVGLRLLSLMLSTDVSAINIKDVARSAKYYERKYSPETVIAALGLINKDRNGKNEWHNPESKLIRGLNRAMRATVNGMEI